MVYIFGSVLTVVGSKYIVLQFVRIWSEGPSNIKFVFLNSSPFCLVSVGSTSFFQFEILCLVATVSQCILESFLYIF